MKRICILIPIITLFSYCGTPNKTGSGTQNPTRNAMRGRPSSEASDTIIVTGTQTLPILGRNEAGVRPDIEGTWELQSSAVNLTTNTNNITSGKSLTGEAAGKEYSGRVIDETMKGSKEVGRDSVTTKSNGVTHTSTTVYLINKDAEGNKITPPQSSNPNVHIPEKPSIRFYGSNETFSGFTGCNKISGRYVMRGNSISFQNAAPSTKMACIGEYDESGFINSLNRVNAIRTGNGKLELLAGNEVLLTFTRK
jgi:heat shock protein HslJ